MVKIERKDTEKAREAILSLEREKQKQTGTYNTEEVNAALKEMFNGKCYICENKHATSCQIEHLIPHKGDKNLEFDWNNLFWACAHCNNTKLGKYEPILDCTKIDVDKKIAFRKKGYFGKEEEYIFEVLDKNEETCNTAELLKDVYYGTTSQKKIEAITIRQQLRKEISEFKEYIRQYKDAEGEDKEDLKCQIRRELKANSSFTAFKRWLIRDNRDWLAEFMECW